MQILMFLSPLVSSFCHGKANPNLAFTQKHLVTFHTTIKIVMVYYKELHTSLGHLLKLHIV